MGTSTCEEVETGCPPVRGIVSDKGAGPPRGGKTVEDSAVRVRVLAWPTGCSGDVEALRLSVFPVRDDLGGVTITTSAVWLGGREDTTPSPSVGGLQEIWPMIQFSQRSTAPLRGFPVVLRMAKKQSASTRFFAQPRHCGQRLVRRTEKGYSERTLNFLR